MKIINKIRSLSVFSLIMKINKRVRLLIVFSLIILTLLASGIVLKNLFLSQIRKKIQASFDYSHLQLSFFPPALIIENVKSLSIPPNFSAKKVELRISYRALLTKQKPFHVTVEQPIMRVYPPPEEKREKGEKKEFAFSLPFLVDVGTIKEGEFYYLGEDTNFQSRGIEAIFVQRRNALIIKAEAEENVFSLGMDRPLLEGKLKVVVESRDQEINLRELNISGPDFELEAKGKLVNLMNPEMDLETSFKARMPLIVDLLHLPFRWKGSAEGNGNLTRTKGEVIFHAEFSSEDLFLNEIELGKVSGRVDFNKDGQTAELDIRKAGMEQEYVKVHYTKEKTEGTVRGFYLDPVFNYFSLPWPVASPAWGNFTIDKEMFEADLNFNDEYFKTEPGLFPFRGPVLFRWDLKKEVSFSSPGLASTFADVEVNGWINVGQDLDLSIQGEVKDVSQAREFTSIILAKNFKFPEIRGEGQAEIRVFADYGSPQVRADFSLSPGGYDKFDFRSVAGGVEIIEDDLFGKFNIDDPDMKGKIDLVSNLEGVKADVQLEQGFIEKIFPSLNIDFPLEGRASGDFKVKQKEEDIELTGSFSGSLMKLVGQELKNVRGQLTWHGDTLSLADLQFQLHKGMVKGNAVIGLSGLEFDIDMQGDAIDLSSFYSGVQGILGFHLKGKGVFGQEYATGPFEIKELYHSPFRKTEAKGEAKFGYSDGMFRLDLSGSFLPGENEFKVLFSIPVDKDWIDVDIRGRVNNLDLILLWKGVKGSLNYLGEVRGPKESAQVKGAIDFQGSLFPWPGFAHAFRDYSGLMFVENDKLTIRSLKAKLGGGDVQGAGELKLGPDGIEMLNLKLEGKNMLLAPLERTRILMDSDLNLVKNPERFILEGNMFARKLQWRREINEEFIFSSSPYYEAKKEPGLFDDLTLDIRIRADDNAWMENALGRIRGRFDLTIKGSVDAPVVTGEIEALGGDVNFQDRKFKILSGRIDFFNPLTTEPYISFRGETFVKDYRVTFSLDGLLDKLNPEFSSSPPLPPEDVLALLALGESFRRTYSYDTSTQLSTASLLSFQLSEEAKKRTEGLFSIDRFRIDPFVMGSSAEMSARLTVGKKVSKNFFILYSTNLTTQREEITRLEWELTPDLSIVGTRNEEGRISFDVKIHKRF